MRETGAVRVPCGMLSARPGDRERRRYFHAPCSALPRPSERVANVRGTGGILRASAANGGERKSNDRTGRVGWFSLSALISGVVSIVVWPRC